MKSGESIYHHSMPHILPAYLSLINGEVPEALLASSRGGTKHRDPGAGIEPFAMGQRIYKDGYMLTTCVKDDMFSHGDKFGDNRCATLLGALLSLGPLNGPF